ncbi:MAG: S-adenosylmethionine:tRNA ribosyltransferase-isomerase [Actinomycetota bacterium]
MRVEDLRYELPDAAIAQRPLEPRDSARLLVAPRRGAVTHRVVRDLPDLVGPGDLLVVNDTRVLPARLLLHKRTGGAVEVLLLSAVSADHSVWEALVRPGKRVRPGTELVDADGQAVLTVGGNRGEEGCREVALHDVGGAADAHRLVARCGVMPLPPYIHEPLADAERYQTVFARVPGSVAAPTAGLHLTDDVLARCRAAGAAVAPVTLDVGLGTFRPMTTVNVADHNMHAERYAIPADTLDAIASAERVIAVGTTSLRTLEAWAATGEVSGSTDLFIYGQYDFRVVDRLFTNFHLPGSSLLALLDAFTDGAWRALYEVALAQGYRFLSFGDAMLVDRATS